MERSELPTRIVAAWILVIGLLGWLPLVRAVFDGASYAWGTTYFGFPIGGDGLGGDFWYLPLRTAFSLLVLCALLRRWRPLGAILATAWTAILFADDMRALIVNPAGNWFHGDTLGIHLNLTLIAPVISGAMLLACALLWAQSVRRGRRGPYPLQPVNLRRLGLLAALLPIQLVLLRFGAPHGLTDQLGVLLTILQWFGMGWALALPKESRRDIPGKKRLLSRAPYDRKLT